MVSLPCDAAALDAPVCGAAEVVAPGTRDGPSRMNRTKCAGPASSMACTVTVIRAVPPSTRVLTSAPASRRDWRPRPLGKARPMPSGDVPRHRRGGRLAGENHLPGHPRGQSRVYLLACRARERTQQGEREPLGL